MRTCHYCREKNIPDSARSHAKFCSDKCRNYYRRHNAEPAPKGVIWELVTTGLGPGNIKSLIQHAAGHCQDCGTPIVGRKRLYCDAKCSNRRFNKRRGIDGRRADLSRARRARERGAFVEQVVAGEVFERDGFICMLCEFPLDMDAVFPEPMFPTIDHIIPLARGGAHSLANVQAAHLHCNIKKGARLVPS